MPPYLSFASLDRKSVRFTMPLATIRRVERLNARAGIYALSMSTSHGMRLVSVTDNVVSTTPLQNSHSCMMIHYAGGATHFPPSNCRRVLWCSQKRAQSRTSTRANESCQDLC